MTPRNFGAIHNNHDFRRASDETEAQSIGTLAATITEKAGREAVSFHQQRMASIAAELDELRASPIQHTARIDEHVRLLAYHRAQIDGIEEQLKGLVL